MKRPACFDGARRCRWRAFRLRAVAFVLPLSGCFSYMPVEPQTVPQGGYVRVEMTRLGFAALPEIPGQPGPRLAGRMTGQNDEQLLLHVPVAVLPDGSEIGRDFEIPTRDVVRVEIRELSPIRTGILIATGLAAGLVGYLGLNKGSPTTAEEVEEQETEGDPGGSLWTAKLFSIRVR